MIFPDENVVRCLLECGAPVNARNELGWSPLLLATLAYNYSDRVCIFFIVFFKINCFCFYKYFFLLTVYFAADKTSTGTRRAYRPTKCRR